MMAPKSNLTIEQIDAVEEALRTVGFYIMENVLTPAEADAARTSTLALAENDIARGLWAQLAQTAAGVHGRQ
jgi:hypothetical protein